MNNYYKLKNIYIKSDKDLNCNLEDNGISKLPNKMKYIHELNIIKNKLNYKCKIEFIQLSLFRNKYEFRYYNGIKYRFINYMKLVRFRIEKNQLIYF